MKLKTWLRLYALLTILLTALIGIGIALLNEGRSEIAARLQALAPIDEKLDRIIKHSRLLSPADLGHARSDIRIFMINSHLRQGRDPIVIAGDSLTEASAPPSMICGHSVVNAGVGGLTPESYAELVKSKGLLSGMKASLLIIALGTNNAQKLSGLSEFESGYRELLSLLKPRAKRIALVGIPPMNNGPLAEYFDASRIPQINATIQKLASEFGAGFVDLNEPLETIDGVHLSAKGYEGWSRTIAATSRATLKCLPDASN